MLERTWRSGKTWALALTSLQQGPIFSGSTNLSCTTCILMRIFHSVSESMLTLFLIISGGMDWNDALIQLRRVSLVAVIFMFIYILLTVSRLHSTRISADMAINFFALLYFVHQLWLHTCAPFLKCVFHTLCGHDRRTCRVGGPVVVWRMQQHSWQCPLKHFRYSVDNPVFTTD